MLASAHLVRADKYGMCCSVRSCDGLQVTVEQVEAWCHARGAIYVEMRSPDEVAAVDLAIDLLVRACVCSRTCSAT